MRPSLLVALVLAACGPASISGTIDGKSADADDAVGNSNTTLGTQTVTVVVGGGSSSLCLDLDAGIAHKGTSTTTLVFGGKTPLATGDYAIGGIPFIDAKFASATTAFLHDDSCDVLLRKGAGGGKITLEAIDGSHFAGTFEVAFGADIVKGSFDAPLCGSVGNAVGNALKTCE